MSDTVTPFATLITVLLSKRYNMDMPTYGALLAVCTVILNYLISIDFDKLSDLKMYVQSYFLHCVIALGVISFALNYSKINFKGLFLRSEKETKYRVLNINTYSDTLIFMRYINYFPEFFEKPSEVQIGIFNKNRTCDPNASILDSESMRVDDGVKVKFHDKNFNVRGYYMWTRVEINSGKYKDSNSDIVRYFQSLQVHVDESTCDDIMKYYNDLEKKVAEINLKKCGTTLYFLKYTAESTRHPNKDGTYIPNHYYEFYNGSLSLEELESKYISTFFSPEKERMWKLAKQVHLNPTQFIKVGQSPQIGWLLHGPPGTGKSSFAYRLAMSLQRHIVSIDIRSVKNREKIFKMVRRPRVCENSHTLNPKNVVYIFDEFDLTVSELCCREKNKNKATNEWLTLLTKFQKDKDDKEDSETTLTPPNLDENMSLTDLLEFFQGPVPLTGAIIIATTNKYEEIKEMCPALVRPGRLTPVYFGNADSKTINEISNYHFGRDIDISPGYIPSISPSQVLSYVMDAKLDESKGFQYFADQINGAINKK